MWNHMVYFFVAEKFWLQAVESLTQLPLGEDSDFKEDGIYGYMTEVDNALSLAVLCSEGVLNAGEEDNLDSNSDIASLGLQEVQQYLCLAWKLSTIDNQCTWWY